MSLSSRCLAAVKNKFHAMSNASTKLALHKSAKLALARSWEKVLTVRRHITAVPLKCLIGIAKAGFTTK